MNATVIIVTLDRPDCLDECLRCLVAQEPRPRQVIVVDSSESDASRAVVSGYPTVEYVRHEGGAGRMTASRNLGLARATGDPVIFIDDDSYVTPGWLAEMVGAFEPGVAAVGGRALRGHPGEEREGADAVGVLTDDGLLLGNFAADPGRAIDVDHIMGCNMAFSRETLAALGGMREAYTGISGVREDTDVCLRIRASGGRIVFNPRAVVHHVGAPQAKGRRFDWRYEFYAERNHCLLLVTNFGLRAPILHRYLRRTAGDRSRGLVERLRAGSVARPLARFLVAYLGNVVGLVQGAGALLSAGRDPARRDSEGVELRRRLSDTAGDPASPSRV